MKKAVSLLARVPWLLLLVCVSCSREAQPSPERALRRLEISVSAWPVRTQLGEENRVYWTAGDRIALNGQASDPLGDMEAATSAHFMFEGDFSMPYRLLYPASFYKDAGTVTLPSVQEYVPGTFASGVLPMACQLDGASQGASMHHLCTVLQLSVRKGARTPETGRLVSVCFTGNGGEQVSGDFAIDYGIPSLTPAAGNAEGRTLTLSLLQALPDAEPLKLFLVVPAADYASGFSVTLTDEAGRTMTMRKSSGALLRPGAVVRMPVFDYVPGPVAVEFGIEDLEEDSLCLDPYDLTGRVTDASGRPLADVVVSDGTQCVKTLPDGRYYMLSAPGAKFVSVSAPSGYEPATTGGLPDFWKKLADITPDAAGVRTADFSLTAADQSRFRVFVTADPQPRARTAGYDKIGYHSLDICTDLYRELRETASASSVPVYGVCLGDLVHENMALFADYAAGLSTLGYPTWNVIGNHDNDPSAADDDAAAVPYESYFGPRNYSFNLGGIHFIVLDNLVMQDEGGVLTAYQQGLSDQAWAWLRADLSFVPKNTTLMVCAHSPMFAYPAKTASGAPTVHHRYGYAATLHGQEYLELLSSYAKVHVWGGHLHLTFNYIYPSSSACPGLESHIVARSTGELWTNDYLAAGTPRGFTIVDVEDGAVSWHFHPTRYQTASWAGGASRPDFSLRAWTWNASGVAVFPGGSLLDEEYQMHLYAPGVYGDGQLYANIFLYDSAWASPVFTPDGGSPVTMSAVKDADRHDAAETEMRSWYKTNNTLLSGSDSYEAPRSGHPYNTLFRVPAAASGSGTVSVTDRFGRVWTQSVNW